MSRSLSCVSAGRVPNVPEGADRVGLGDALLKGFMAD